MQIVYRNKISWFGSFFSPIFSPVITALICLPNWWDLAVKNKQLKMWEIKFSGFHRWSSEIKITKSWFYQVGMLHNEFVRFQSQSTKPNLRFLAWRENVVFISQIFINLVGSTKEVFIILARFVFCLARSVRTLYSNCIKSVWKFTVDSGTPFNWNKIGLVEIRA